MSVNDATGMVIEDSRVMLQIVASLTDDFRGVIYIHNMFIVQATGCSENKLECLSERKKFSLVFYLEVNARGLTKRPGTIGTGVFFGLTHKY